jgi:dTDP-4-amino-4,6-dideoxygalactose transaminase
MNVPFLDLRAQYHSLQSTLDRAWRNVVDESAFIRGKFVSDFESEFSRITGAEHCIGVGNGTDALFIILKCLGIGAGDEVITPANSWISSSETIGQTGATAVFADVEKDFFCMDPAQLEKRITSKTKAVIAVHLFGQAADIDSIKAICDKHKLFMVEDCAQAHLTEYKGKVVGTFGDAAAFSFYPGKNLGAYGDAGGIIASNHKLAEKMRMYANHGSLVKHEHIIEGINSRLDGLQAAVLSAKLPYLKGWNRRRNELADNYRDLLTGVNEITLPEVRPGAHHTFHLYVIRCERRNELQAWLKESGIETQIHYPCPLPFLKAYGHQKNRREDFPVAAELQSQILSLPIYPEMERTAQYYVCEKIREFYSK